MRNRDLGHAAPSPSASIRTITVSEKLQWDTRYCAMRHCRRQNRRPRCIIEHHFGSNLGSAKKKSVGDLSRPHQTPATQKVPVELAVIMTALQGQPAKPQALQTREEFLRRAHL